MTIQQWIENYRTIRQNVLAPPTLTHHLRVLASLGEWVGLDAEVGSISPLAAAAWHASLHTAGKLGEQTICRWVRDAKTIWNHAIVMEVASKNPFAGLRGTAPAPRREIAEISHEQVEAMMRHSKPDYRRMLALAWFAGLRRHEILSLRWGSVGQDRIRVRVERPTTKARDRDVLLMPELAAILEPDRGTVESLVVKARPGAVRNTLRRAMALAGVPLYDKPLHTLRSRRATLWRELYPEHVVDAWMGHSLAVARRHYTTVDAKYYGDR